MSIIKAKKCEVEIQEQTDPDAACRYMVILSYEPEHKISKEIISIVLTNRKPHLKQTIDKGNVIEEKEENVRGVVAGKFTPEGFELPKGFKLDRE